eukprot:749032-Hanusia_phi.AAC.2
MLEWLKQRVIAWLLSRHVGRWIVIERNNLHSDTSGAVWRLVAENLLVKTNCLDGLGLPFRVQSGVVKNFTIDWQKEQSVIVSIDTIHISLETCDVQDISKDESEERERSNKLKLLEEWEMQLDDSISKKKERDPSQAKADEDVENVPQLYRAFLDKLEVKVSNVHLSFQDLKHGTKYGMVIENIAFENSDHFDLSTGFSEHIQKFISLLGCSIYIDRSTIDSHANSWNDESNLVLRPLSASCCIGYDRPRAKPDLKRPKVMIRFKTPVFNVILDHAQIQSSNSLLTLFERKTSFNVIHEHRPSTRIRGNGKMWWKYAIRRVIEDIEERRQRLSHTYLCQRRRDRLDYVEIYLKRRKGKITKAEQSRIQQIEKTYGYSDVVFFRCTAISHSKTRSLIGESNQSHGRSWMSRLWWKRASTEGEDFEQPESALLTMSKEERESLLKAVDVDAIGPGDSYDSLFSSASSAQVLISCEMELNAFRLIARKDSTFHAVFTSEGGFIAFKRKSKAVESNAELKSMSIWDKTSDSPVCWVSTSGTSESQPLLRCAFNSDWSEKPSTANLMIKSSSVELVAANDFIQNLIEFANVFESVMESDLHQTKLISDTGNAEISQNALYVARETVWHFDIDVFAPSIHISPTLLSNVGQNLISLRFGRFRVCQEQEDSKPTSCEYQVQLEHVGVEIMYDATLSDSEMFVQSRKSVLNDTGVEGSLRCHFKDLDSTNDFDYSLDLTVHDIGLNMDKESMLVMQSVLRSCSANVTLHNDLNFRNLDFFYLIVKGLESQTGWCYRFASVAHGKLVMCKEKSSVFHEYYSLQDVVISGAFEDGNPVIVLTPSANSQNAQTLKLYAGDSHSLIYAMLNKERKMASSSKELWTAIQPGTLVSDFDNFNKCTPMYEAPKLSFIIRSKHVEVLIEDPESESSTICLHVNDLTSTLVLLNTSESFQFQFENLEISRHHGADLVRGYFSKRWDHTKAHFGLSVKYSWDRASHRLPETIVDLSDHDISIDSNLLKTVLSLIELLQSTNDKNQISEDGLRRSETNAEASRIDVPASFLISNTTDRTLSSSSCWQAKGLHVKLLGEDDARVYSFSMTDSTWKANFFGDGTIELKGRLQSVDLKDLTSPAQSCSSLLDVRSKTESFVHFDVQIFDPTSVSSSITSQSWKLSIHQPRLTLLWRCVQEVREFANTFTTVKETTNLSSNDERTSNKITFKLDFIHPEIYIPRNSYMDEGLLVDLGLLHVENENGMLAWDMDFRQMSISSVLDESLSCAICKNFDMSANIALLPSDESADIVLDLTLKNVKAEMDDSQLVILLSVIGENFSEKRIHDDMKSLQDVKHSQEEKKTFDSLPNLKDMMRVSLKIPDLEFEFLWKNESREKFLGVAAKDVKILYAAFYDTDEIVKPLYDCKVTLGKVCILDMDDAKTTKPLLSVPAASLEVAECNRESLVSLYFAKYGSGDMKITFNFQCAETIADVRLLMQIIRWVSSKPSEFQDASNTLSYSRSISGSLAFQTKFPNARVVLYSRKDECRKEIFDLRGSFYFDYEMRESDSLMTFVASDVYMILCDGVLPDVSDQSLQILKPCSLSMSRRSAKRGEGVPAANTQTSVDFEKINAILTYRYVMLGLQVLRTLQDDLLSPPTDHEMNDLPTDATLDQDESRSEESLSVKGSELTVSLINDCRGRWIPLLRAKAPKLEMSGSLTNILLRGDELLCDYFHHPTSLWKPAIEPVNLEVSYLYKELSKNFELHVRSTKSEILAHVSRAGIDSIYDSILSWASDEEFLQQREQAGRSDKPFVPYLITNNMAEALICILQDGTEIRLGTKESCCLSYEQVWSRRDALSTFARDYDDTGINNMVCLQLEGANQIFGTMSLEVRYL